MSYFTFHDIEDSFNLKNDSSLFIFDARKNFTIYMYIHRYMHRYTVSSDQSVLLLKLNINLQKIDKYKNYSSCGK